MSNFPIPFGSDLPEPYDAMIICKEHWEFLKKDLINSHNATHINTIKQGFTGTLFGINLFIEPTDMELIKWVTDFRNLSGRDPRIVKFEKSKPQYINIEFKFGELEWIY